MKRFIAGLLIALICTVNAVCAQTVLGAPGRLLAKQFNGNTENFTTTNPDLGGTPLTLASATGVTPSNGIVMLSVGAGFTPPVTLTAFFWQQDLVTPANSGWRRFGNAAASYAQALDATYTSCAFSGPPNTPFLIMSSAGITGNVYTNAKAHPSNNNTASGGYPN